MQISENSAGVGFRLLLKIFKSWDVKIFCAIIKRLTRIGIKVE